MNPEQIRVLRSILVDESTCWIWQGATSTSGYGRLRYRGTLWMSHRFAYAAWKGEPAAGLTLDHLCRVRRCVNPDHLEPVTNQENVRRGVEARGLAAACPSGHAYTPDNVYVRPNGKRRCRKCIRKSQLAWLARQV